MIGDAIHDAAMSQEAGADPQDPGERQFWPSGANGQPGFTADSDGFPHDATGDDGGSAGPFQQQPNGSGDARRWRCSDQTAIP